MQFIFVLSITVVNQPFLPIGRNTSLKLTESAQGGCESYQEETFDVTGHDSEVVMDFMNVEDTQEDAHRSLALRQQEVHMLSSQVLHLRRELMNACADAEHELAVVK